MLTRLTAFEWLVLGLLVTILGRVETSRPLAGLGLLLVAWALLRDRRRVP